MGNPFEDDSVDIDEEPSRLTRAEYAVWDELLVRRDGDLTTDERHALHEVLRKQDPRGNGKRPMRKEKTHQ